MSVNNQEKNRFITQKDPLGLLEEYEGHELTKDQIEELENISTSLARSKEDIKVGRTYDARKNLELRMERLTQKHHV